MNEDTPNDGSVSVAFDLFGAHVKRLREVRRLTQEELAARSGLAADTVRRLEHQEFSPSLRTLRKVCKGLGLSVAVMFNSFELGENEASAELSRIHALLLGRAQAELVLVERVLSELFDGLDRYRRGG
jgi:transcriptional regulator with XRE-family HTH domain